MEKLFENISISSNDLEINNKKNKGNCNLQNLDLENSEESWDLSNSEKNEEISINLKSITEEEKSFSFNIEYSQKCSKKIFEKKIIDNYIDNDISEVSEFSLCSKLKQKLKKKKIEKTQMLIRDNLSKKFLNKKLEDLQILLEDRLDFLNNNKENNIFMIKKIENCLKMKRKNKVFYVYCLVQSRFNK